jgi:23S rRNA pseudouridine2605 synthase
MTASGGRMRERSGGRTPTGVIRPEGPRALRVHKIIAEAGLASRREAEQWLRAGRITVNGRVVTRPGTCVDPRTDHIRIDGKLLGAPVAKAYYAFHKPLGVVSTMKDERERASVADFLNGPQRRHGIFPIGRLDYNSSGLLLLTNDGALAHRIMHPQYRIKKVYLVKLSGLPSEGQLDRLRHGIRLSDGQAGAAEVRVLRKLKQKAWLEVSIREGRYREIRRMMEAIGQRVERLVRARIGPISLGGLALGKIRPLSFEEVREMQRLVGLVGAGRRRRSKDELKRGLAPVHLPREN